MLAIGPASRARVVAPEMGTQYFTDWSASQAADDLLTTMMKYGVEGGAWWRWVNDQNNEDTDPSQGQQQAVKVRGVNWTYNPVKDVLARYYLRP